MCLEMAIDYGGEFAMLTIFGFLLMVIGNYFALVTIKSGMIRSIPFTFVGGFLMYFASGDNSYIESIFAQILIGMIIGVTSVLVNLFAGYILRRLKVAGLV